MAFQFSNQQKPSVSASAFSSQYKKQRILLVVFGVLVVAIGLVLYFSFGSSGDSPAGSTGTEWNGTTQETESTMEKINFDADFFDSQAFKDLELYGDKSLEPDKKGKDQPFLPSN